MKRETPKNGGLEDLLFFSHPLWTFTFTSLTIPFFYGKHTENAWMWWIGGFLVKTSRTSGWASIGMLTRDHDVITGSLDTFLGDRTSQPKSSIFRLLSRDYTPGKLTWQWTIPTMNESCCISSPPKIGDFLHLLVASGGLEEHPQHTSPPQKTHGFQRFHQGLAKSWQRHSLCCGGVARARKPPTNAAGFILFCLFFLNIFLIYCT